MKIFDSVIKPILLYGSDVWGAYLYKSIYQHNSIQNALNDVAGLIEKLHSKFCKQVLRVHKRTSNFAVRFELGRLPLFVNIVCRILKYFVNICKRDPSSVVNIALKLHKMYDNSWFAFVKSIVNILGCDVNNLTTGMIKGNKNSVYTKLKAATQVVYQSKIAECNKLALYSSIKSNLNMEPYLSLLDPNLRKSVSQIRLSCHKLPIETGRYLNIPRQDRLCTFCKYTVGSEKHYLMECFHPSLANLRNQFLTNIFKINPFLQSLPRDCLFKYILCFTDKSIIDITAKYVNNVLRLL